MELARAPVRISYAREILRSRARLHLAIACPIVRTIFLVGPGFEPLALHMIFFVGPGFDSLTLQHDLFVGPGFDSRTLITCFQARSIRGLCHSPPRLEDQVGFCGKNKTSVRKKSYEARLAEKTKTSVRKKYPVKPFQQAKTCWCR